jgi:DNA-binding response OmpR family regulator
MRIAIVDGDTAFVEFLESIASADGHSCVSFTDAESFATEVQRDAFDLVVLDWHLPAGGEVVSWIGGNLDVLPVVVMLTGQYDKARIARALIDDAIARPVDTAPDMDGVFEGYRFDRQDSSVTFDGGAQKLTAKEFALALLFFQNTNRPLSRAYLLDAVWNSVEGLPTRTLDVHVSHIRAKLKLAAGRGYRLQTIVGYGYRLELCEEDEPALGG